MTEVLPENAELISEDYDAFVESLFAEMVKRNNTYKEASLDMKVLEQFERKAVVIFGLKALFERITSENKKKLALLIEKGEAIYKIHFFMADGVASFKEYAYEPWYKRHVSGSDGIWIGDGIADQYSLKLNKMSSEYYDDIGSDYGYVVERGKAVLTKLLSSTPEEEY